MLALSLIQSLNFNTPIALVLIQFFHHIAFYTVGCIHSSFRNMANTLVDNCFGCNAKVFPLC